MYYLFSGIRWLWGSQPLWSQNTQQFCQLGKWKGKLKISLSLTHLDESTPTAFHIQDFNRALPFAAGFCGVLSLLAILKSLKSHEFSYCPPRAVVSVCWNAVNMEAGGQPRCFNISKKKKVPQPERVSIIKTDNSHLRRGVLDRDISGKYKETPYKRWGR